MLVDEILKGIPDDTHLTDAAQPWVANLIAAVNTALNQEDVNLERLSLTSTGLELRSAVKLLQARTQISILNDVVISSGFKNRRQNDVEAEEAQLKVDDHRLKHNAMKFGIFLIGALVAVVVVATVYLKVKGQDGPDASIFNGLLNTMMEIIKLLFSM